MASLAGGSSKTKTYDRDLLVYVVQLFNSSWFLVLTSVHFLKTVQHIEPLPLEVQERQNGRTEEQKNRGLLGANLRWLLMSNISQHPN